MSEELDNLLEETTGLVMAVDELHNKLPELSKIKQQIEKRTQEFETLSLNQKKELTTVINKGISELSKFIDNSNDTLKQADEKLKQTIKLQNELLKLKEEIINTKHSIDNDEIIDLVADYATPHTIYYLFNKYKNTNIPIIVRKIESTPNSASVWSDNYCFYVRNISNGIVDGNYYSFGEKTDLDKKSPSPKNVLFVLYSNKEDINKILTSKD